MTKEDINDIDSFMTAGVFASNIGDLVVDVCADVLGLPIVVISSLSQMNVSIHLPKHQQHSDSPIYLSYDASASGHYDGTKSFVEQENNDSDIEGRLIYFYLADFSSYRYIYFKLRNCF